ncbi:MAG: HPF/RaiA family ribosome-associated protein [Pseudomonadota bacterium]|nr:HPF/RaiA family ribosome-associated protein [Pseudomonadota bacterium]
MFTVVFKNLDKSDLTKEAVITRLQETIDRFPDLVGHKITVTLSMENSPQQAGPDHFTVKVHVRGKKYRDVLIEKSAMNLYLALADVNEHLLERLNRMGDRTRVKLRSKRIRLLDHPDEVEDGL